VLFVSKYIQTPERPRSIRTHCIYQNMDKIYSFKSKIQTFSDLTQKRTSRFSTWRIICTKPIFACFYILD